MCDAFRSCYCGNIVGIQAIVGVGAEDAIHEETSLQRKSIIVIWRQRRRRHITMMDLRYNYNEASLCMASSAPTIA